MIKFKKLILATNNRHKIEEITAILSDLGVEILTKNDLTDFPEVEETAETLAGNALQKSRAIFRQYGIPALADDSGLEVEFLQGAPGVLSARYAGAGCTFADNNHKLLREMEGVPPEQRRARFVTVIAVSHAGGDICLEGDVWGRITAREQGTSGFGYDPVFFYPPTERTFAEMTFPEKNLISHRGLALKKLREWLVAR